MSSKYNIMENDRATPCMLRRINQGFWRGRLLKTWITLLSTAGTDGDHYNRSTINYLPSFRSNDELLSFTTQRKI